MVSSTLAMYVGVLGARTRLTVPPRQHGPEPEPPDTPETFDFGLRVINVSEADASAAVIVLRSGGRRGVSHLTWWTTDGTATAGADYAALDPAVVLARWSRGVVRRHGRRLREAPGHDQERSVRRPRPPGAPWAGWRTGRSTR